MGDEFETIELNAEFQTMFRQLDERVKFFQLQMENLALKIQVKFSLTDEWVLMQDGTRFYFEKSKNEVQPDGTLDE